VFGLRIKKRKTKGLKTCHFLKYSGAVRDSSSDGVLTDRSFCAVHGDGLL